MFDNGITAVTLQRDENSVERHCHRPREKTWGQITDPDEGDNVTYSSSAAGGGCQSLIWLRTNRKKKKKKKRKKKKKNWQILSIGSHSIESAPRRWTQVGRLDLDYGSARYLECNIVAPDVNEPPMFVAGSGEIPDVTILEGLRTTPCIMASDYFTDPDTRDQGAGLLVTAHSSRRNIATVSVVNNEEICITGVDPGTGPSTVTVTLKTVAVFRSGNALRCRSAKLAADSPSIFPIQQFKNRESLDIDLNQFFDDAMPVQDTQNESHTRSRFRCHRGYCDDCARFEASHSAIP